MTWYLIIATSKKISPFSGADKMRGEFAVVEQLKALSEDIEAHAPSQITFERTGKKRFPEPKESIYFPNYVFAQIPDDLFYQAIQCQGVSPTVMRIHQNDVTGLRRKGDEMVQTGGGVLEAIRRADRNREEAEKIIAEMEQAQRDIEQAKAMREQAKRSREEEAKARAALREARLKMSNYKPGDILEILGGPFAGQAARFKRMVQFANEVQPSLEVEIEAFGGWVPGQIDPLDVKKRA